MARYVTVTPAYGRDYTSQKAVQADWDAGKDFEIQDFELRGYISKSEVPHGMVINVRYAKLMKVYQVKQ